jgi:hypothetical protein
METRNLAATIDSKAINVSGEAYVPNSNTTASLVRTEPQGINTKILLLDLKTSRGQGGGAEVFTWVSIAYDEAATKGQFNQVSLLSSDGPPATVDVREAA